MKLLVPLVFALAMFVLSCSLPNECQLSERYSPARSWFVKDKGHNKYDFRVSFDQYVEIYTGDCATEKSRNETRLKITSFAPCDQVLDMTIKVDLGDLDSYEIKDDSLAIPANGTVDLGIVRRGGPRIDFAEVDIAIFCPLCPGDE